MPDMIGRHVVHLFALLVSVLSIGDVLAQTPTAFPTKPMTIIVPFSPGGPADALGRLLAQEYRSRSGQPVTVENRTGGAGNIGIDAVKKSAGDGATLLVIPAGNLTINPTLMKGLSFEVERDFAPITVLATAPNVIVASPRLGITTVSELVSKSKTKVLSYGTPGIGSQLHLAMELVKDRTGAELLHVPYRGSSQALSDLLGGHIDLLATNLPAVLSAIRAGSAIPIAMTTTTRSSLVPDVPTLAEAGITGIDVTSWYGLLAPHSTPRDVVDAILEVTRTVLQTREIAEKLESQGLFVMLEPTEQFATRIKRETDLWANVIRSRQLRPQ